MAALQHIEASWDAAARRARQLARPEAFPHPVTHVETRETHISWVILTGAFAYKIKKPVRYGFLDASTLERRRELCEAEVRLNRMFAPDLYLDVVPVVDTPSGPVVGGSGPAIEYAVRMREFEPGQELDQLLAREDVSLRQAQELGMLLADLHARAQQADPRSLHGGYDLIAQQARENFRALRGTSFDRAHGDALEHLSRWSEQALRDLRDVFARRKAEGAVRQCHGDLHARNLVRWRDGWVAYDCIEFDPALSWIDVISDFAFLYMDLASYGRWDLASACLATYLENTGDYAGLALLRFYSVYRALVRAKVDALAAEAGGESANAWRARMASRVDVASRLTARHRPTLMIMHGVTACGKSWVSEQLIPLLHAVRVRSDLERKRLQGVSPFVQRGAAVNAGPYAADATRETYAAMLGCAEHALRAGFNTIADATFLLKSDRERFRELARSLDCGFLVLACDADADALRRRVAARRQSGQEISEADEAVLSHQLATVEPLDDSERQCCIRLDTNWITSADTGIESVRDRVGRHAAPTT